MSSNKSFKLDPKRAKEIAETLHSQYKTGKSLFEKHRPPDYAPPPGMIAGSKGHALYLTYIFTLEQDGDPSALWKKATELYKETPWFFDAEHILTRSDEGLSKALVKLGVSDVNTSLKRWRELSKILLENYSGDPRNLPKVPEPELRKAIREILGTNEDRQIHRYLQLMTTNKLPKTKDLENLGIFVDRNVAIYTLYTGILRLDSEQFEGFLDRDPILSLTRKAWNESLAAIGVPPWELDDAIHIVSSKLCPKKKCLLCPVYEQCERGFNLEVDGNRIRLGGMKVAEPYTATFCSRCGRDQPKGSRFCDGCGSEIPKERPS